MSIEPHGAADWAGIAAFLAVIGGGLKWLSSKLTWRTDRSAVREAAEVEAARDERIEAREERYIAKVEKRITAIEAELLTIKRDYGVVVGVAHVMVDELIVLSPATPALALVTAKIREAYPIPTETPSEMLHLLHRLDAADFKRGAR